MTAARTPPEHLLTIAEAAERLQVSKSLAEQLIRRGDVPSLKIGRLRRIRPADIDEYTARQVAATEEASGIRVRRIWDEIKQKGNAIEEMTGTRTYTKQNAK